ncbi:hypothetical protein PTKIN_Ptkin01aG0073600 [Pterospermum kingtungense]
MSKVSSSVPKSIDKGCPRDASWTPAAVRDKHVAVSVTEEQVRGIFDRYDANKDGRLTKEEVKDAFACLGSRMPRVRALLARKHADDNRDGYINGAEVEKLVKYTLERGYLFK